MHAFAGSTPTDIRVVHDIDAADVDLLARGGRVLLLGHRPFAAGRTEFQTSVAGRPNGNLATVIHPHPVFDDFPHGHFCDWQFQPLLDGGHAVIFDELSLPYDPILEVASSFKNAQRQAAVFELRVGRGRLMVCGLNLKGEDTVSRFLLDRILRHVSSAAWVPRTQVEPRELDHAIRPRSITREDLETDMAFDRNAQLPPV